MRDAPKIYVFAKANETPPAHNPVSLSAPKLVPQDIGPRVYTLESLLSRDNIRDLERDIPSRAASFLAILIQLRASERVLLSAGTNY